MTENLQALADYIEQAITKSYNLTHNIVNGELRVNVTSENLLSVLNFLRDDDKCRFKILISICGVDYPGREKRFEVVYCLLSTKYNLRIRIHVETGENEPVPSAESLYSSASWFERETWDMYGIMFSNNSDLRRILTDYGFVGHPLRKDFPVTGYVEVRYDVEKKRVVYEPVRLEQEFRNFDLMMPWEGTKYVLPGDEKAVK